MIFLARPPPEDRGRRERLEADVFAWHAWYASDDFTRDFTGQQREMIAALHVAITKGGDQAIAASRGEGKTTVAERVIGFAILTGAVRFLVLFSATGADAEHSLASISTVSLTSFG